jgi:hypothetical protein
MQNRRKIRILIRLHLIKNKIISYEPNNSSYAEGKEIYEIYFSLEDYWQINKSKVFIL